MKIGVTGGSGFIGSHVVDRLHELGHQAVLFDRRSAEFRFVDGQAQHVPVFMGDVMDPVATAELAAHVDGIIHLAAVLGTQETVANPVPAVMTNVRGSLNIFEACTAYDIPVVNICVGNTGMANPYSASKTCAETLGLMYLRDRGLRINQIRAVNAYGERQSMAAPYGPARVRKIMPAFIARALTGAPIEVYGDGRQVSDMVYVGDVAAALVRAVEAAAGGTCAPEVMQIGPMQSATVLQVAELVQDEADELGYPQVDIVHLPMRPGETPGAHVTADPTTLDCIGYDWLKMARLSETLPRIVRWYAEHWLPGYLARS